MNLRKVWYALRNQGLIWFVELEGPWVKAKFYIGWEEYREHGHYRERLMALGFRYAFDQFLNRNEWKYYYKKRVEREPHTYWRVLFFPWTVEMPPLLQTAANSEIFKTQEGV